MKEFLYVSTIITKADSYVAIYIMRRGSVNDDNVLIRIAIYMTRFAKMCIIIVHTSNFC